VLHFLQSFLVSLKMYIYSLGLQTLKTAFYLAHLLVHMHLKKKIAAKLQVYKRAFNEIKNTSSF
jgi:hypothetical protein